MKRKELEKLPVLRATTAMLEQAEKEPMVQTGYFRKELRYEHEHYARCKQFDRILKVAIYLTKNLVAGGRKPVYELFLDYDAQNFLTYSFAEKSGVLQCSTIYRSRDLVSMTCRSHPVTPL